MANPRQRRKQKSGAASVKQSRRQQDKLKKIVVQGPSSLVREWNPHRTAAQNYQALGLAHKQPLPLRRSGGAETQLVLLDELPAIDYSSSSDSELDSDFIEGPDRDEVTRAGPSARTQKPEKLLTSKDIPKGFARIERDAQGNVTRVITSAFDDQNLNHEENEATQTDSQGLSDNEDREDAETPWGRPLNRTRSDRALLEKTKQIGAKNAAVRDLEARSAAEKASKTPRYASSAENEVLRRLVQEHGNDIDAMSRDMKLNRDQRTKGQLRKQLDKAGGIESLLHM